MKVRILIGLAGLALVLLQIPAIQAQQLFINEFVARNKASLIDPDEDFNNGDPYEDWIEIYNAGAAPVDLGGMYLTDDLTNLLQYQIPSTLPAKTTIPAGGFLVLYADKETHQGILHLDFKLSGGGEQIGLTANDGITVLDSLTFKGQDADTSFGRSIDGGPVWRYFLEPTPGASNGKLKLATLYINEFLARNEASLQDPDEDAVDGDPFEDWIEIYNPGSAPVDIGGMFVSDNLSNLSQWQIPDNAPAATTIPAGGFLLLFADREMHQGPLHVDFKLSGLGEQLALVANDGVTIIDSLSFAAQAADTSFGRSTDGGAEWTTFISPTPGATNSTSAVAENVAGNLPATFTLQQNYPNPFNPATTIVYDVAVATDVQLKVYNLAGQEITTLVDGWQNAGRHAVQWNGKLANGRQVNSGVYFYKMQTGKFVQMKKMLLVK